MDAEKADLIRELFDEEEQRAYVSRSLLPPPGDEVTEWWADKLLKERQNTKTDKRT